VTRGDRILVGAVLVVALALVPPTLGVASEDARVARVSAPGGTTAFALDEAGTHEFRGHVGEVVVTVGDAGAAIVHADCPNGDCLDMGPATRPGDAVVCAPNGVTIVVDGGPEVDDVVR
jgi:hypothetical protein